MNRWADGESGRSSRKLVGCAVADVNVELLSMDTWTPRMLDASRFAPECMELAREGAEWADQTAPGAQ